MSWQGYHKKVGEANPGPDAFEIFEYMANFTMYYNSPQGGTQESGGAGGKGVDGVDGFSLPWLSGEGRGGGGGGWWGGDAIITVDSKNHSSGAGGSNYTGSGSAAFVSNSVNGTINQFGNGTVRIRWVE
jgi:hypothetical protein